MQTLNQIAPDRASLLGLRHCIRMALHAHHPKCCDHGYVREAIRKETTSEAEQPKRDTRERRSNDARELKLRRVQRNCVGKIFTADKIVRECEVRWARE